MALVAGGGGGKAVDYSQFLAPATTSQTDEEEERKREKARQDAAALAAHPIVQQQAPAQSIWDTPSQQIQDKASAASNIKGLYEQPHDPVQGYWSTSRQMGGQQQAAQRLQTIDHILKSYMTPYDTSKMIMPLFQSPYSTTEIESMAQAGHMGMFASGHLSTPLKVPAPLVTSLGLDPANPVHTASTAVRTIAQGYLQAPASVMHAPQMLPNHPAIVGVGAGSAGAAGLPEKDQSYLAPIPTAAQTDPQQMARAVAHEQWFTEWAQKQPKALTSLVRLTGIDPSKYQTWADYDTALQNWKGAQKFTKADQFDSAYHQMVVDRSQYVMANHGDEETAFGLQGLKQAGDATLNAGIMASSLIFPVSDVAATMGEAAGRAAPLIRGAVQASRIYTGQQVLTAANDSWGNANPTIQGIINQGAKAGYMLAGGGVLGDIAGGIGGETASTAAKWAAAGLKGAGGMGQFMGALQGGSALVGAMGAPKQLQTQADLNAQQNAVGSPEATQQMERETLLNPAIAPSLLTLTSAQGQLQGMISQLDQVKPTDGPGLWKYIQSDQKDGNGNVVTPGFGQDIEWPGVFTTAMKQAAADKLASQKRYNVEVQRQLMESNYAPANLPLDGVLGPGADPRWTAAAQTAQTDIARDAAWSAAHPFASRITQIMGVPITKAGWDAKERGMFQNGLIEGGLNNLLMLGNMAGGLYNSALASVSYGTSVLTDREYNGLKKQYTDALAANSPDLQAIQDKMVARKAWITQNTTIPDAIMPAYDLFSQGDVNAAVNWNHAHPGLSTAADLARDAILAFAMPAAKEAVKGAFTPKLDFNDAMSSRQVMKPADTMTGLVLKGPEHLQLATDTVGHTADAETLVRNVNALYQGKAPGRVSLGAWEPIAKEMLDTADQGGASRIAELTNLDQSGVQQLASKLADIKAKDGVLDPQADRVAQAARVLAKMQKADKGLLNMTQVGRESLAHAWADGKSVLPDLKSPIIDKPSVVHRAILEKVASIQNDNVREFATAFLAPLEVKAPRTVDLGNNLYNSNRIYSAALAAFGDARVAMTKASEWIRNPSPERRIQIGEEISQGLSDRFKLPGMQPPFEERETAAGINPTTGEMLTPDSPAIPTYLRYTADLGNQQAALTAPYNIMDDWGAARKTVTKLLNVGRAIQRPLARPSNWMRHWTVALGPLLGIKHSVSDTSRSFIESPFAILNARGEALGLEDRLSTLDPETANIVRYQKSIREATLAHYYGHATDLQADFKGDQIYEAKPNGKLVASKKDIAGGADALRRIATDPVFKAWTDSGVDGVRSYLNTAEGRSFMGRSGILQSFKENGGAELNEAGAYFGEVKGKSVYDAAVEHYIEAVARPLFGGLESMAPNITDGLKDMATGKRPATSDEVKSLLNEVNGQGVKENPYLSVAAQADNPIYQKLVGTWMTPNRLNRNAIFNRLFNQAFDDAVKNGVEPNQAAKVGMDVAGLGVEAVHFDLSNALNIEAQHKWFAWFATKHRMYDTYLVKMLAERPSIAGAAQTLMNYIEKNNSDPSIPDYDKNKISINLDKLPGVSAVMGKLFGSPSGNTMRIDLSTMWWLNDAMAESAMGQIAETGGAQVARLIPGMPYVPTMSSFGLSSGRWDQTLGTIAVGLPIWVQAAKGQLTDDWLKQYLDGTAGGGVATVGEAFGKLDTYVHQGKGAMQSLKNAIDVQQALAMHNGVKLSPSEAGYLASMYGAAYQALQMEKVWPGRIVFGSDQRYSDLLTQYNKATPAERKTMLDTNPDMRFVFGEYSTNPVDQVAISSGFQRMNTITKERSLALYSALHNGSIYDSSAVNAIYDKYDAQLQEMTDPNWRDQQGNPSPYRNDTFATFLGGLNGTTGDFDKVMKGIFPLADPRVWTADGYIPDASQQSEMADHLKEQFESAVKDAGLDPVKNSSDPTVIWMRKDMVTDPMNAYVKYQNNDGWTTSFEKTVADQLAQGAGGPNARTQFLTEIHRQDLMQALAKGTVGNAKAGVSGLPMFATLSTEDKSLLGWNSTTAAENIWRNYCKLYSQQSAFMEQNGIASTSSKGKALRAQLVAWGEQQTQKDTTFASEWYYSHMPVEQRLDMLGIGKAGTPVAQGWSDFLGLVQSYKNDLAKVPNKTSPTKYGVGPTAQGAAKIQAKYWPELQKMKEQYPGWWQQLTQVFGSLSKFGFVHWKPPKGQYTDLFLGEDDVDAYASDATITEGD